MYLYDVDYDNVHDNITGFVSAQTGVSVLLPPGCVVRLKTQKGENEIP